MKLKQIAASAAVVGGRPAGVGAAAPGAADLGERQPAGVGCRLAALGRMDERLLHPDVLIAQSQRPPESPFPGAVRHVRGADGPAGGGVPVGSCSGGDVGAGRDNGPTGPAVPVAGRCAAGASVGGADAEAAAAAASAAHAAWSWSAAKVAPWSIIPESSYWLCTEKLDPCGSHTRSLSTHRSMVLAGVQRTDGDLRVADRVHEPW